MDPHEMLELYQKYCIRVNIRNTKPQFIFLFKIILDIYIRAQLFIIVYYMVVIKTFYLEITIFETRCLSH